MPNYILFNGVSSGPYDIERQGDQWTVNAKKFVKKWLQINLLSPYFLDIEKLRNNSG
jgi:hypothetical protein